MSITLIYLTVDALRVSSEVRVYNAEQRSVMTATDITLRRADSMGVLYEGSVKSAIKDGIKEVLLGVDIAKKGENTEMLKADIITNFPEKTLFDRGFTYTDDKGVTLSANLATYDKERKTVEGSNGFTLTSSELDSQGKSFTYYIESKELKASNINAKFDGEKL